MLKTFIVAVLLMTHPDIIPPEDFAWGFYAHKKINRFAIFTLPSPLIGFYKKHSLYLEENATRPDKRRYVVEWEGPRHFLDWEAYPDSLLSNMPLSWNSVKDRFDTTFFNRNGTLPWNLSQMRYRLTEAFRSGNREQILKLSTESGHYLADANVPLHTTENFNGQLTGQHGIHGLWESRLPELFSEQYQLLTGRARYLVAPDSTIWKYILASRAAVDSVLAFEVITSLSTREDRKYSFEKRGTAMVKTYSYEYARQYHQRLAGMVARQMRRSIQLIGDFWYTCWVDAGMPDLW